MSRSRSISNSKLYHNSTTESEKEKQMRVSLKSLEKNFRIYPIKRQTTWKQLEPVDPSAEGPYNSGAS